MEDRQYEDEISLKELIMALVNNWKLIVIFVAVFAVLALGYVMIVVDDVYESSVDGIISVPESTTTRYGLYEFPTTNKMDYLNEVYSNSLIEKLIIELELDEATVEGLRNSITIESEEESTRFAFKITGESPEEAMNRLMVLKGLYLEEIRTKYKESALSYFIRDYHVTGKQLEETLLNQQMQLNDIETDFADVSPVITLQKLVISDPVYAAELAKSRGLRIEDLSGDMMVEEVVNPNYETIQGDIIEIKKSILETEREIEKNIKYSNELKAELSALQTYVLDGDGSQMMGDTLNVLDSRVIISARPSFPRNPLAQNKALTLAIALVLGGMLGVFVAFFKEYWKNN